MGNETVTSRAIMGNAVLKQAFQKSRTQAKIAYQRLELTISKYFGQ